MQDIIQTHQLNLFDSICRALLEKDKLIFSFLMCIKILESEGLISPLETRFLMVGGTWTESEKVQGKSKAWLSEKAWYTICEFSKVVPALHGFDDDFENHETRWKDLFDSENP